METTNSTFWHQLSELIETIIRNTTDNNDPIACRHPARVISALGAAMFRLQNEGEEVALLHLRQLCNRLESGLNLTERVTVDIDRNYNPELHAEVPCFAWRDSSGQIFFTNDDVERPYGFLNLPDWQILDWAVECLIDEYGIHPPANGYVNYL